MIKQAYLALAVQCGATPSHAETLWQEIERAYTGAGRFYHDLSHLERLYQDLKPLPTDDWPTLFFALVYHDVVFDVEQHMVMHDDEERSAAFAERHLKTIGYPQDKIEHCRQLILATKNYRQAADHDTNLFTDADLSILGKPWPVYDVYRRQIRQEFSVYPDSIFSAGRKKVLLAFLEMEPLFKTANFRERYEKSAKENLKEELALL